MSFLIHFRQKEREKKIQSEKERDIGTERDRESQRKRKRKREPEREMIVCENAKQCNKRNREIEKKRLAKASFQVAVRF